MRTNFEWQLITQVSHFVIYEGLTIIARVPRRLLHARQNACIISRLPQMLDAACSAADSADHDSISAAAILRIRCILDGTAGYSDAPWRARGHSIWGFGRLRLIATCPDPRLTASAAGAADLACVLQLVVDHADEAAVHRTAPAAISLLQATAWGEQFSLLWRTRPRHDSRLPVAPARHLLHEPPPRSADPRRLTPSATSAPSDAPSKP